MSHICFWILRVIFADWCSDFPSEAVQLEQHYTSICTCWFQCVWLCTDPFRIVIARRHPSTLSPTADWCSEVEVFPYACFNFCFSVRSLFVIATEWSHFEAETGCSFQTVLKMKIIAYIINMVVLGLFSRAPTCSPTRFAVEASCQQSMVAFRLA